MRHRWELSEFLCPIAGVRVAQSCRTCPRIIRSLACARAGFVERLWGVMGGSFMCLCHFLSVVLMLRYCSAPYEWFGRSVELVPGSVRARFAHGCTLHALTPLNHSLSIPGPRPDCRCARSPYRSVDYCWPSVRIAGSAGCRPPLPHESLFCACLLACLSACL